MLRLFRRSRLLALALLLATPALGGAWLQFAHPCPVDAPWTAEHGGHGAEHGGADASSGCHCVGTCAPGILAALGADDPSPAAAVSIPPAGSPLVPAAQAPSLRPADRLPPATAPPLA